MKSATNVRELALLRDLATYNNILENNGNQTASPRKNLFSYTLYLETPRIELGVCRDLSHLTWNEQR